MKKSFLAGLTQTEFMRRHWQKAPLLTPRALPDYADAVTREDLIALAQRDDVESRIVRRSAGSWHVQHGPFTARDIARLPRTGWTLLVQGVDQKLRQAARLLREFSFIPYARLDDVMISYAAPGGGVGPHFDSYDVFLLQGQGTRRWQISRQRDLELLEDAPVKILKRFASEHEWRVGPGDLLYLPPQCAHNGVAIGECITYSIGFRAPSAQELGQQFLEYLQDRLALDGMYEDPDLTPTRAPGRIPQSLIDSAVSTLERLRWSRADVTRFMGAYLTEPKAHVVFDTPARSGTFDAFVRRVRNRGLRLALPTRLLISGRRLFINGESLHAPARTLKLFSALADERELRAPLDFDATAGRVLYAWYCAGYIEIGAAPAT
ncbi:MAG TPA: cupin domain-containing protein [Burkholderiales bacterium]|nr:cupin domain-containing protein [Burkholderiales bacterium]